MKKIRELKPDIPNLHYSDSIPTIYRKVNQIIENQNLIIDRLNQEVSQPEENKETIEINRKLYSEILQMIFLLEEKLQSGDVYGASKVLGMFSSTTAEFKELGRLLSSN